MSETLSQNSAPVDLTPTQFIAAVACRLGDSPMPFRTLSKRYGVPLSALSGSSWWLTHHKLIQHTRDPGGWEAGSKHDVRLIVPRGGKLCRLKAGERISLLPQIFGEGAQFVIGGVYDLRVIAAEAKQRQEAEQAA